jgi:hypothetical protein
MRVGNCPFLLLYFLTKEELRVFGRVQGHMTTTRVIDVPLTLMCSILCFLSSILHTAMEVDRMVNVTEKGAFSINAELPVLPSFSQDVKKGT